MVKNKHKTDTNTAPKSEEALKDQDLNVAATTSEDAESKEIAVDTAAAADDSNKAADATEANAKNTDAEAKADESKAKADDSADKDSESDKSKDKSDSNTSDTSKGTNSLSNPQVSIGSSIDPSDKPVLEAFKAHVIVVTSGKGGVGKTTSAASISTGLARSGHKTAVIDFDVGLRNLDLLMGCERRVVYDFINVLHGEARLNQALIQDRNTSNLFILPASQTKDKDALTLNGVGQVLKELSDSGFEYIICDSPAGIEKGALLALYYADEAIVTTNPEISSVRDSDRIIGILNAKSRRAINNWEPVQARLLLTRYMPERVNRDEMLSVDDIQGLLTIPLLGVIPESKDVLGASNLGVPIILNQESHAGQAYTDAVNRLLGKDVPMRFTTEKSKGFFQKLFGK